VSAKVDWAACLIPVGLLWWVVCAAAVGHPSKGSGSCGASRVGRGGWVSRDLRWVEVMRWNVPGVGGSAVGVVEPPVVVVQLPDISQMKVEPVGW